MCLRPQSAGSTIPRLRPTGSSLGIAPVDYDPVVLHKPFGPRLAAGALPSRASSLVAPGVLICVPASSVLPREPLHTFHPLWPVRHCPHLRISVRGPGPSGTSTHLTRQLPGTHDGAADCRPVRGDDETGSPVLHIALQCRVDRQLGWLGTAGGSVGVPLRGCCPVR